MSNVRFKIQRVYALMCQNTTLSELHIIKHSSLCTQLTVLHKATCIDDMSFSTSAHTA
jgi:hypothetical protein